MTRLCGTPDGRGCYLVGPLPSLPQKLHPQDLKGTSTLACRLLGHRKLDEPLPESVPPCDNACGIGPGDSVHGLHRVKLGEFGMHAAVQSTSRSRNLLRRAGSWLLSGGASSARHHNNRPDSSWEEQGTADARVVSGSNYPYLYRQFHQTERPGF